MKTPNKDSAYTGDEMTQQERDMAVAEVLTSNVHPEPSGKYHSTVIGDERLSVGAELFVCPVGPVAEDVVRNLITECRAALAEGESNEPTTR